jgi:hypothetical protein
MRQEPDSMDAAIQLGMHAWRMLLLMLAGAPAIEG